MRRIEEATGVRRETAGGYLKAAGISVRPPGRWGWQRAKPANKVTADSEGAKPALEAGDPDASRLPSAVKTQSSRSVSACESYRELIELGLSRGRNAMAIWQDLVTQHGFTAVIKASSVS